MARHSTRRGGDALYTQFCIGVELGDDSLVRELVLRGADTMVSYGVDGVITTPMHSALSKGDLSMTLALLSSKSTKVRLADLDTAPKVKRELITPVLVQRLSTALEDGAREMLLQRPAVKTTARRPAKVALTEYLADHLRNASVSDSEDSPPSPPSLLQASPNDRERCPPKELLISEPEETDDEETEEQSSEDEKPSTTGSIGSSAGESSEDDA